MVVKKGVALWFSVVVCNAALCVVRRWRKLVLRGLGDGARRDHGSADWTLRTGLPPIWGRGERARSGEKDGTRFVMEIDGVRTGGGREVAVMLVEVVGRSCSADRPEPFRLPWDQEDVKGGLSNNCGNTSLGDNRDTTRKLHGR